MAEQHPSHEQPREGVSFEQIAANALLRLPEVVRERDSWHYAATHDEMTGALNRRGMKEALETNARPTAVLAVDGDSIKAINDTLGHERGDQAIISSVELLRRCTRPEDKIVRLGGDELAVLLNSSSKPSEQPISAERRHEHLAETDELVMIIKNRLKEETAAYLAEPENADLLQAGFGLSVGGAVWHEGMTIDELLKLADQDMYRDKGDKRR